MNGNEAWATVMATSDPQALAVMWCEAIRQRDDLMTLIDMLYVLGPGDHCDVVAREYVELASALAATIVDQPAGEVRWDYLREAIAEFRVIKRDALADRLEDIIARYGGAR